MGLGFVQACMVEGECNQGIEGICKEVRLKDKISRIRVSESLQKEQCE